MDNPMIYKTGYDHELATQSFSKNLLHTLHKFEVQNNIIALCIGTDRSTGDSLGPLTGTLIEQNSSVDVTVLGTLDNPVHALNLEEILTYINKCHPQAFVIAIDACLGRMNNVGQIQLVNGPLQPGAGVNKSLPQVGNIHINGIVNISGFMEYFVLQNTRLSTVMKMAHIISSSISTAIEEFHSSDSDISLSV